MKSFKDFSNNIVIERVVKTTQKPVNINLAKPILPMQGGESGVSQAQVSQDIANTNAQRALDKKRAEAVKKGYVDPNTGRVQERGVITNRIREAGLGYGDPGKDPTRYGINPGDVAQEKSTLFKRAVSPSRAERRAARSEIRAGIQSIEKRYPGATTNPNPTPFRGFSARAGYSGPTRSDLETLQRQSRPGTTTSSSETIRQTLRNTPTGRAADAAFRQRLGLDTPEGAAAAQDAAIDMKADSKAGRTTPEGRPVPQVRRSNTNVVPPTPPAPTRTQVQPRTSGPRVTTSSRTQSWQGPTAAPVKPAPVKPAPVKPAPVKPAPVKPTRIKLTTVKPAPVAPTPSPIQAGTTPATTLTKQIGDEVRKTMSAERTARTVANNRAWARGLKGLGLVGAGLEAKYGYDMARAQGGSDTRSKVAGAVRALGGLTGAGLGATGGGILGPVGSVAGGTLGYTQGADVATKLFNRIVKPGEKVTTQSVIKNVGDLYRDKVPSSIRSRVPEGLKRTFKDFMLKAGRKYGDWRRSQNRNQNEEYVNEGALKVLRHPIVRRTAVGQAANAVYDAALNTFVPRQHRQTVDTIVDVASWGQLAPVAATVEILRRPPEERTGSYHDPKRTPGAEAQHQSNQTRLRQASRPPVQTQPTVGQMRYLNRNYGSWTNPTTGARGGGIGTRKP